MTDQFLWFQVQRNSYSRNWNTTLLLKPDCHSWWISKMQSGCEDTLEERYAIKFCFNLGKKCHRNVWNASDCFSTILHELEHRFLSGIRDSRKAGSLWGMMRGVGGVRKSIHQSWLAKGLVLGLGLQCWGFKGVQEEIPSEEANTLQIGSVAFPAGECTSPQLHPCHRLFDQGGHQDSSLRPYSPDHAPYDFWLFPKLRGCHYCDNWGDESGCDEGHWHAYTKGTSMQLCRSCWNATTCAFQPEEITKRGTRVSWVYYQ